MTLDKLTLEYESSGRREQLQALFNPDKLAFRHAAGWQNAGAARADGISLLKFTGCPPATLALDLFFDTYDVPDATSIHWPGSLLPFDSEGRNAPYSVLGKTREIEQLTRPDRETHQPPICTLRWGRSFLFHGVLVEARTTVTLFLPDGTPVRATVGCNFTAREGNLSPAKELHSADVTKKYTVQPGDTLTLIAASMYMDASCWRPIARANGLDDPLRLTPGQILLIPKLRD